MFGILASKMIGKKTDVDATVGMSQLSSVLWRDIAGRCDRGHVTCVRTCVTLGRKSEQQQLQPS